MSRGGRVVRLAVVVLGALLGLVARLARPPRAVMAPAPVPVVEPPAAPVGPVVQAIRVGLGAIGVGGLVYAAFLYTVGVSPRSTPGLLEWLIAAVILHDGILSPLAFGASILLRRTGRRLPGAVLAIVQVAVVVGVILTLIVLPEIKAKAIGARNASVVPFDYALRLGITWAVLIALAVVASLIVLRLQRRRPGHRAARDRSPLGRHRTA